MIDSRLRSLIDPSRFPPGMEFICASDTGTYNAHLICGVTPDPADLFVFEEFPNYRYVGGEIELTGDSNARIAKKLRIAWRFYTMGRRPLRSWVDANSQFIQDYRQYGVTLQVNTRRLELRTEITRTYFSSGHVWLAPWLSVLPYELEEAHWPKEETQGGRYERVKRHDHTLDCLEHVCSRRPRGKLQVRQRSESFRERWLREHRIPGLGRGDVHLGSR